MKRLSIVFIITLLVISCNKKEETLIHKDVESAVLTKERQALDQWSGGNPIGFAENISETATYFDDISAHTRLDGIEEIKAHLSSLHGKVPVHQYEIIDPKVQLIGNAAILTFNYHGKIGDQAAPPWKATSVYEYKNKDWKIVHAHWSLVKENPNDIL